MKPTTPLLWAVAGGSWGGAAVNAAQAGHWGFALFAGAGAAVLGAFAAYLQYRLVHRPVSSPP